MWMLLKRALIKRQKKIASLLIAGCQAYLKAYPNPVRSIFGSHTNQTEAKALLALGENLYKLSNLDASDVTKFLSETIRQLDSLSNGKLKKSISADGQLETLIINILAKITHEPADTIRLNVNLSGSGIGGLSLADYIRVAERSVAEKTIPMQEMKK